jgi:hypothetical protein
MLVLADLAPDTTGYRLLLLGHILTVVVGFGSSFVYPLLGVQAKNRRGVQALALSESSLFAAKRITTPVIYAAGVFGILLVGFGPWGLSDEWVMAAITIFIALVLFAGFVHVPNLVRMDDLTRTLANAGPPPEGASGPPPEALEMEKRGAAAARNGGILHLGFLIVLILMIWKPGA